MIHRSVNFPTFSRYEGSWNKAVGTMTGFGTYTFPDGSTYHGYFSDGHFHGFGAMKIVTPQKYIIKGTFIHGRCVKIHELYFADGLEFQGRFHKDGTLNARNWDYCDKYNRLYFTEERNGLEPPGPHAFLTATRKARVTPKGTYDTGDGIFNPSTGFIVLTEKTYETSKLRFVACAADREYIKKNYRLSKGIDGSVQPKEPEMEISKEIILCNLQAMCHRHEDATCMCKSKMQRDRYYGNIYPSNICPRRKKKQVDGQDEDVVVEDEKIEIDSSSDIDLTASSSSVQSFDEVIEPCENNILDQSEKDEESIEPEQKPRFGLWHKKELMTKIIRFSNDPGK